MSKRRKRRPEKTFVTFVAFCCCLFRRAKKILRHSAPVMAQVLVALPLVATCQIPSLGQVLALCKQWNILSPSALKIIWPLAGFGAGAAALTPNKIGGDVSHQ